MNRFAWLAVCSVLLVPARSPAQSANPLDARNVGGTLRQSLFGLEFHTPEAVLGGEVHGSVLFDVFASSDAGLDRALAVKLQTSPRLRTAWIEGRWGNRSVLGGLANSIVSPREPSSLAQVFVPALSAAGNLYGSWRRRPASSSRAWSFGVATSAIWPAPMPTAFPF